MARPNTYVLLKQAEQQNRMLRQEVERMKGFTLQQSLDMALITLNTEFGFGPERCAAFEDAFRATFMYYANLALDDDADDSEIWYTKEKLDRALRRACGENILSFDQRYAPDHLYLRTRDLKEKMDG